MGKDKVKLGFVGVGTMGQMAHLRNYITLDDCEVAALAEVREQTGRLVAERYGIPKVYKDHREMLDREKLDGVVASQPFSLHAVLLPDIYPRVKNVLTEKPLAVSPAAGTTLARAAASAGCTHMVGYHKRSDPATAYAQEVVAGWKKSGAMGALKYVRILMPSGDWIAGGLTGILNAGDTCPPMAGEALMADLDKTTADRYISFVNYYIHQVNLMRYLLGEQYRVMYAEKSGVLLAVESVSGIPGVIEMTPYRTTIAWEESALIAFEKGHITLRLPAPLAGNRCGTVEVYEDPGNKTPLRTSPTLPWIHAMRQQAVNFIKVCKGEMAPPCAAAEAVLDLQAARDYIRLRYGK